MMLLVAWPSIGLEEELFFSSPQSIERTYKSALKVGGAGLTYEKQQQQQQQ